MGQSLLKSIPGIHQSNNHCMSINWLITINSLTAIFITRFILDLRDTGSQNLATIPSLPTLQFASQLTGNIGASLSEPGWMQSACDDVEYNDNDSEDSNIVVEESSTEYVEGMESTSTFINN